MKKRVLLLAVSCRNGGLCPGGLDLDNPKQWIRIVKDDGNAGAVQGHEIDFAKPLDVIEFDGKPMPQGRQVENWVVLNHTCRNLGRAELVKCSSGQGLQGFQIHPQGVAINGELDRTDSIKAILSWSQGCYSYRGFWGNYKPFLNESEFNAGNEPTESILRVSNVKIHGSKTSNGEIKAKIDFLWSEARYPINWVSLTDQDYYDKIKDGNEVEIPQAFIVISIPKELLPFTGTGELRAYKFVSKVFEL